ncbi:MAG: hypothetical protein ABIK32_08660, partial [Chloroflexota bacterium]
MNNPLGNGGCGGRAGKKSENFHSDGDGSRGCATSLPGAAAYVKGISIFAFALRNSIAGIQFPAATSDLSDLIKAEKPSGLRM